MVLGTREIVTQHMTGNFTVAFDGDTAEASVRMRNHHAGVGPRAGLFQESIGAFGGTFAHTATGWRCSHWYEDIWVNLGDGEALFASEIGGGT